MHDQESKNPAAVIRAVYPNAESRWFGLRHRLVSCPVDFKHETMWWEHENKLQQICDKKSLLRAVVSGGSFYAVTAQSIGMPIVVDNVCEEDGYTWYYKCNGMIAVKDATALIQRLGEFCKGDGLPVALFSVYFQARLRTVIRDQICGYMQQYGVSIGDMERNSALDENYWEKELGSSPCLDGCSILITEANFFVPGRELEEADEGCKEAERKFIQDCQRENERAIEKMKIEANRKKTEWDIKEYLDKVKHEYELAQARREKELDNLRNHETKMREMIGEVVKREEVPRSADNGSNTVMSKGGDDKTLARLRLLLRQLHSVKRSERHAARQELMSPAFRLSKDDITRITGQTDPDPSSALLETLKKRNMSEAEGRVSVVKVDDGRKNLNVSTRTAGILKDARVTAIHRGSKLNFTISSGRHSGYLTVLNIGPDGDVNLLVPNAECTDGHIEKGETVAVPGEPYFRARTCLVELSSTGVDQFVAIVSQTPVLSNIMVKRLVNEQNNTCGTALLTLTENEIADLNNTLKGLSIEKFSVGMLSFHISE